MIEILFELKSQFEHNLTHLNCLKTELLDIYKDVLDFKLNYYYCHKVI